MRSYFGRKCAARVVVFLAVGRQRRILGGMPQISPLIDLTIPNPVHRRTPADAAAVVPHPLDPVVLAFEEVILVVDRVLFPIDPPALAVRESVLHLVGFRQRDFALMLLPPEVYAGAVIQRISSDHATALAKLKGGAVRPAVLEWFG
jgi:hypothetical protein